MWTRTQVSEYANNTVITLADGDEDIILVRFTSRLDNEVIRKTNAILDGLNQSEAWSEAMIINHDPIVDGVTDGP